MRKPRTAAEIRRLIGADADSMTDAEVLEVWDAYYRLAWAWLDALESSPAVEQFLVRRETPAMEQR